MAGCIKACRWLSVEAEQEFRGHVGQNDFGYIPCGDIHAEREFGDLVLPSAVTVGWWYRTPRYTPFFEATILDARPVG